MRKFYCVTVKCGHVGKGKCIYLNMPIVANSANEAASLARISPRVKHHHKDAIKQVLEVCYSKYLLIVDAYKNNPYTHCHCVQDQRLIEGLEKQIVDDPHFVRKEKTRDRDVIAYKLRKAELRCKADMAEIRGYIA